MNGHLDIASERHVSPVLNLLDAVGAEYYPAAPERQRPDRAASFRVELRGWRRDDLLALTRVVDRMLDGLGHHEAARMFLLDPTAARPVKEISEQAVIGEGGAAS